ncbi:MAG TPA: HEPN domain-containing protein [Tepidisphaeraceae bacterium]|nr:HEPN domain-containing protein [Tepidisphaeraceae bacterium]
MEKRSESGRLHDVAPSGFTTRPPPPAIGAAGFKELAKARLADAEILFANARYDGAVYLCGYSVEFTLKARICSLLGWSTYFTDREYATFRTHDLTVLLNLSGAGIMFDMGAPFARDWAFVLAFWSNQLRYEPHGTMTQQDATKMIQAVGNLMSAL